MFYALMYLFIYIVVLMMYLSWPQTHYEAQAGLSFPYTRNVGSYHHIHLKLTPGKYEF